MKTGGGKRKGGAFERDICRVISLFWSNGAFKDICWRSAGSGSHATVSRSKTKSHHGDICPMSPMIEPLFKMFSIECKFYKKIDITQILRGIIGNKLLDFWRQTCRSAILSNRKPVLIARRNNFPTMLILKVTDAMLFADVMKKRIPYMTLGGKLAVFTLDDFVAHADVKAFVTKVEGLALGNK